MDAESYVKTDSLLIPTGEIAPVDGTPFDFRKGKLVGDEVDADNVDLKIAGVLRPLLQFHRRRE